MLTTPQMDDKVSVMVKSDKKVMFTAALTDEDDRLVRRFASLLGLPRSSAIKMHLRQSLPARINELESAMQSVHRTAAGQASQVPSAQTRSA